MQHVRISLERAGDRTCDRHMVVLIEIIHTQLRVEPIGHLPYKESAI